MGAPSHNVRMQLQRCVSWGEHKKQWQERQAGAHSLTYWELSVTKSILIFTSSLDLSRQPFAGQAEVGREKEREFDRWR